MGFLDLFRSKYRHSDVRVRLEAVRSMTSDDAEILATVARTDKDASVRRVAIEKLDEVDVLAEVAKKDAEANLRDLASERAAEIWVSSACQDEDQALHVRRAAGHRLAATHQSIDTGRPPRLDGHVRRRNGSVEISPLCPGRAGVIG